MNLTELSSVGLELSVVTLAMLVLLADALSAVFDARKLGQITAIGLLGLLFASFFFLPLEGPTFHGMFALDALALFFKRLFLTAGAFVALMSTDFVAETRRSAGSFFAVILLALTGMMLCASANDFVMLFVSVELITVSFYVLVSFLRRDEKSLEAGTKYLIIGALSSGFMVFGIAFIFGTTGATNFQAVAVAIGGNAQAATPMLPNSEIASGTLVLPLTMSVALWFGIIMVLVGLGFKSGSVPFQIWIPDVYQGAPTPVTSFLAVGSKAAGFALLLRVLFTAWRPAFDDGGKLALLVAALAGLTMLYGNLAAMPQRNVKRLLGYSSIGHAGYMLMGVAAANVLGVQAVLYYLAAYLFTNLCAFMVIIAVSRATGSDEIPSYSGLAKRSPLLAAAMLLAMFSLAGIPPLAGFFGKFLLFTAVIEAARLDSQLYVLALIGAVGVVISLYFYLGVVRAMYLQEAEDDRAIAVSLPMRAALYAAMAGILMLGFFQKPMLTFTQTAADSLFERNHSASVDAAKDERREGAAVAPLH